MTVGSEWHGGVVTLPGLDRLRTPTDPGYAIEQRDRIDAAFKEAWADLCPDIDPEHVPSWCGTIIVLHRILKRLEKAT